MKTLGQIACDAYMTGDDLWESAADAVAKAIGQRLIEKIIGEMSVGSNTDDLDSTEWCCMEIEHACGLTGLTEKTLAAWWEKNAAAHEAWYTPKPVTSPGSIMTTILRNREDKK